MAKRTVSKKIVGSVAVDSETGVEHYQVAKQVSKKDEPNDAYAGVSPNYGENTVGEAQNIAHVPDEFLNLFEHDPSEIIIKQALKHPVGVWFIYTVAVLTVLMIAFGATLLFSDSATFGVSGFSSAVKAFGALGTLIVGTLIIAIAFVAVVVYKKSRLILTNQKLVYIRYHSLFSRKISQLNIGEVEDVSVSQKTIWERLFKMGSLTIETAGEQNNYVFTHVAKPHEFARLTIQAHEGSIAEYGN